jgi:hypothetical protein
MKQNGGRFEGSSFYWHACITDFTASCFLCFEKYQTDDRSLCDLSAARIVYPHTGVAGKTSLRAAWTPQ